MTKEQGYINTSMHRTHDVKSSPYLLEQHTIAKNHRTSCSAMASSCLLWLRNIASFSQATIFLSHSGQGETPALNAPRTDFKKMPRQHTPRRIWSWAKTFSCLLWLRNMCFKRHIFLSHSGQEGASALTDRTENKLNIYSPAFEVHNILNKIFRCW